MITQTRILRTFLLVAAALTFFGCQPKAETTATTTGSSTTTGAQAGLKIVYVRLDSLQTGYTALAAELTRLEENVEKAQNNIQGQLAALQREAQQMQNKIQQGLMTPNSIQAEQQRFARKEQEIQQQRDIALNSIQMDQMQLQQQFGDRVKEILETIRAENGYDFILNEGGGSGLLLGNDAYDITNMVLDRLNADDSPVMVKDTVQ